MNRKDCSLGELVRADSQVTIAAIVLAVIWLIDLVSGKR